MLLTIVALATGIAAHASDFTIEVDGNRFTIKRDNTTTQEKVYFRTVSQSALDGVHFTGKSGIAVFQVGDDSYPITINETAGSSLSDVYHYQTDASRTYRFEVLDTRGILLSYKNRTISYGNEYKVPTTQLNSSITDLIYFTDAGNFASGSGNKYLDVYNTDSQSGYTQVRDGGYGQGVHNIDVAPLFSNNDNLKNYFRSILGCSMYATIGFTQKEENDGYQYIQILANNESTYDGTDSDGSVSTPSISLYKACFILSYSPSGSVMSNDHYQFFPHRYDYVDKATEISNGISHYEFDYDNSHLYRQAYRNTSFKANNSGSLVLPLTVNTLNVRFNAKGGGNDHDEWDFKNLFARLALVDETAPRQSATPVLNPGPYNVGSNFYVSVIFNEPVKYTTAPTLTTTWGTMTAMAGHGSNVLTFKGTISTSTTHGTALNVTALGGGTITDLAGNAYTGSVSQSFGSATAVARYNFDSSTSTLNLNWGPFSKNNKWGSDITAAAVRKVNTPYDAMSSTSTVRFVGDCSELFKDFTNCTKFDLVSAETSAMTNTHAMFSGCASMSVINTNGWDTGNVTDMGEMFSGCAAITSFELSHFNTAAVTDMSGMFSGCASLNSLTISNTNWNTAAVTDMSNMFNGCAALTSLSVSSWNIGNVTDMSGMFNGCRVLNGLGVGSWSTVSVTDMSNMFNGCAALTSLNVSSWNTAAVTNMSNIFNGCSGLPTLDVHSWNVSKVTNMSNMFKGCSSLNLTSPDVKNWNTQAVTTMESMFEDCSSLTALDVSKWKTAAVTNMASLFKNCSSLATIDVSKWTTAAVTDMRSMFQGCQNIAALNLTLWDTSNVTSMQTMFNTCSNLATIYASTLWSTASVTSSSNMFTACSSLVGGNGTAYSDSYINVARARIDKPDEPGYLTGVFTLTMPDDVRATAGVVFTINGTNYYRGGSDITLLYSGTPPDGSRFDHFTVNDEPVEGNTFTMPFADSEIGVEYQARYTFDSATGTLTLNWGEFNKDNKWGNDVPADDVLSVTATSDVSFTGNCYNLFYNFTNCTSMDLGDANTDALTSMFCMFYNCTSLTALNVANWNTASVTDMGYMFSGCSSLTTLDVSNWNTASVTDFGFMFRGCSSLTTLDVSYW
ncbi:MAG: BspA family leucine-rich repeat surface protein, partial [Muribaculaceae bacterium]|nr:BspA family leucine-rich repeat surface protein [Muribaculaceae bacterium]